MVRSVYCRRRISVIYSYVNTAANHRRYLCIMTAGGASAIDGRAWCVCYQSTSSATTETSSCWCCRTTICLSRSQQMADSLLISQPLDVLCCGSVLCDWERLGCWYEAGVLVPLNFVPWNRPWMTTLRNVKRILPGYDIVGESHTRAGRWLGILLSVGCDIAGEPKTVDKEYCHFLVVISQLNQRQSIRNTVISWLWYRSWTKDSR